jgi:hypothetical protein
MDRETILRDEIVGDPLGRGYAGMTDAQVFASLTTADRSRARNLIPAHELFEAITAADLAALGAGEQKRLQFLMSMGEVNIEGVNTRAVLVAMFSGATQPTKDALLALQTQAITRAEELGLGTLRLGHVQVARS